MSGVDVVVGTPSSLLRIFERKILDLKELRHIVSKDCRLMTNTLLYDSVHTVGSR